MTKTKGYAGGNIIKKKSSSSLTKYFILAVLVFAVSVLISVLTRLLLVTNVFPWSFSDEQFSLIAGLIEGIVASVAAITFRV